MCFALPESEIDADPRALRVPPGQPVVADSGSGMVVETEMIVSVDWDGPETADETRPLEKAAKKDGSSALAVAGVAMAAVGSSKEAAPALPPTKVPSPAQQPTSALPRLAVLEESVNISTLESSVLPATELESSASCSSQHVAAPPPQTSLGSAAAPQTTLGSLDQAKEVPGPSGASYAGDVFFLGPSSSPQETNRRKRKLSESPQVGTDSQSLDVVPFVGQNLIKSNFFHNQ